MGKKKQKKKRLQPIRNHPAFRSLCI